MPPQLSAHYSTQVASPLAIAVGYALCWAGKCQGFSQNMPHDAQKMAFRQVERLGTLFFVVFLLP